MIVTLCVWRLKWLWNELPVRVNAFQNPIFLMNEFEDYSVLLRVISDFVSFASYGNVVHVGDNVLELILIDWLFSPESVAWSYKVRWRMMIIIISRLSFDSKWWRFWLWLFMQWYHYHFDFDLIMLWVLQIIKRFNSWILFARVMYVMIWLWCGYQWIYFESITSIIYWKFLKILDII